MQLTIASVTLSVLLAPLLGAAIAGLVGHYIGHRGAHSITILGLTISFLGAAYIFYHIVILGEPPLHKIFYAWGVSGDYTFNIGIWIDRLTAVMMTTVTFISLLVHVYSIGYMRDDPGYQRFFAYMSLFTFFMLTLVAADNFLMLFFGWEGVGLVSYLLIGFWYQKETAVQGSLKAFLINRVGDCGFVLGIAATFAYFGSLDYDSVFKQAPLWQGATLSVLPHVHWSVITVVCVLLFIGAMGKSAQLPLHVWLPESMEGPTPISALIHAATMVTAGVYMIARLSPLYELSQPALSLVTVVGASGALFLGIIALVQNDIKRVIAYSTMSQLGYMMAANGLSAFSVGIFHLVTHACFKALLFLAAGSVIVALHHEQDMRNMGNLKKYLPITCLTFLIGALALAAIPPFSGFYSKDAIIEVARTATIPGAGFAYVCLLLGAFVTSLYIFRAFFLTFFTTERIPSALRDHVRESQSVLLAPLVLLALPSMFLGGLLVESMVYSTHFSLLGDSVYVAKQYDFLGKIVNHYHGVLYDTIMGFAHPPVWFSIAGIVSAWLCYVKFPWLPAWLHQRFKLIYWVLYHKYGFDAFNQLVFVRGGRALSNFLYTVADVKFIDGFLVDGSGRGVTRIAAWMRKLQSGYLYTYALVMIIGVFGFLVWFLVNG